MLTKKNIEKLFELNVKIINHLDGILTEPINNKFLSSEENKEAFELLENVRSYYLVANENITYILNGLTYP